MTVYLCTSRQSSTEEDLIHVDMEVNADFTTFGFAVTGTDAVHRLGPFWATRVCVCVVAKPICLHNAMQLTSRI